MLVGVEGASHCKFVTPAGLFQLQEQATTKRELPRRATGIFRLNTYNPLHSERLLAATGLGSEARRPVNEVVRRLRAARFCNAGLRDGQVALAKYL